MDLLTELEAVKKGLEAAPSSGKAADVVAHLVSETLDALRRGLECADFERRQIVYGCLPTSKASEANPKTWVPHITQLQRVLAAHSERVELLLMNRGGRGNTGTYRLQLVTSAGEEDVAPANAEAAAFVSIRYVRSSINGIKPFFLVRPFLNKELKNRSWRGLVFLLGFVLLGALVTGVVPILLLLALVYGTATIELKQIVSLALLFVVSWGVWRQVYRPFFQLIDDRVVKAPAWVIGLMEDPCELEMHRQEDGQWTRLVRFQAECSLCGGAVELRPGTPDHRYPLVGRCGNSPHAHVYSFDRMLLCGSYIGPPLAWEANQ
ncbi:hypothetical protein [Pseudomonas sp. BN411]|uniref:hypothetical protein n=1 Tax=Pseudomonas sp. BN411 TaxID=2567887 RepID=UPI002455908D|nr:hypothetical protein [Pseudomonas sp. BN411]MDH4562886.1 hypothetical protein [Pseudomonas sp. BN411]